MSYDSVNILSIRGNMSAKAVKLVNGRILLNATENSCFAELANCVAFTFKALLKFSDDNSKIIFNSSWLDF